MDSRQKPRFRGVSHMYAFFVAIGAFAMLLAACANGRATTVASVYGVTLLMLFGISGLYHVRMWGLRGRALMRRLDHAGIFIFIAGSYTPVCILGLPESEAMVPLVGAWTFAALGTVHSIFFVQRFRTFNAVLFVAMGCGMIPFLPQLALAVGSAGMTLLLAGGLTYVVGAVVYARRWPDPSPAIFGYHEVFHVLVIAATGLQYFAILGLVSAG